MPALQSSKISFWAGREEQLFFHTPSLHKSEPLPLPWQCNIWFKGCPWPVVLCHCSHFYQIKGTIAKGCRFDLFLLNRSAGPNCWQPSPVPELCDERPYHGRLQCIFLSVLPGTACSRWRPAGAAAKPCPTAVPWWQQQYPVFRPQLPLTAMETVAPITIL